MALTVSQTRRNSVSGNRITTFLTATFDNSYAGPAGEALDLTNYVPRIDMVNIEQKDGYTVAYDSTVGALKVYWQTDPADGGGANIPLVDVDPTTDLSTLTVNISVTGGRA